MRRPNRRQLLLRLASTLLAVLSMVALLVRPSKTIDVNFSDAVLLTDGASIDQATALIDSAKISRVFTLNLAFKSSNNRPSSLDVTSIPDAAFLRRRFPDVTTLHVFGNGLAAHDLADLNGIELRLHLNEPPDGFHYAPALETSPFGKPIFIRGVYHQSDGKSARLYFADASGALDSLSTIPNGDTPFEFSTTPKAIGRFLYTLSAHTATGDTMAVESVPIFVSPLDTLSLLVLESAPTFETKHLKNWAAATGNRIAIRSAVSKGKTTTEFLNIEKRSLARLTVEALNTFDVALLDVASLAALSNLERDALKRAVEAGLGVCITLDDVSEARRTFSDSNFFLDLNARQIEPERPVKPIGFGISPSAISPIAAVGLELKADDDATILASDERRRPLVMSRFRGLGRTAIGILHDTYRWVLEGKSTVHAAYWSHILNAVARRKLNEDDWRLAPETPIVDMPITMNVRSSSSFPVGIVRGKATVDTMFLAQDVLEPMLWHGVFWARATGWHSIANVDSRPTWFYVFGKHERRAQRAIEMQTLTKRFAEMQSSPVARDARQIKREEPMPLWWFLVVFVVATAYLWAERKF